MQITFNPLVKNNYLNRNSKNTKPAQFQNIANRNVDVSFQAFCLEGLLQSIKCFSKSLLKKGLPRSANSAIKPNNRMVTRKGIYPLPPPMSELETYLLLTQPIPPINDPHTRIPPLPAYMDEQQLYLATIGQTFDLRHRWY